MNATQKLCKCNVHAMQIFLHFSSSLGTFAVIFKNYAKQLPKINHHDGKKKTEVFATFSPFSDPTQARIRIVLYSPESIEMTRGLVRVSLRLDWRL